MNTESCKQRNMNVNQKKKRNVILTSVENYFSNLVFQMK